MEFRIDVEQAVRKVPVTVFHLSGSLNIASVGAFENASRQAVKKGTRYLLLDFKEVDAVRSAGLRSVQVLYRLLSPKAPERVTARLTISPYLKIANMSPDVYKVFDISGFLRNIESFDDLETALDSFQ
jgi:anti-anti-sigma regulatory factor